MASPASAAPDSQAYHLYTGQPSNWTCGSTVTVDTVGIYARTCIVLASDGASFQDVTIVNNTAGTPQQVNTESSFTRNGVQDPDYGSCVGFGNNSTEQPLAAHTAYYCPGPTRTATHGTVLGGIGIGYNPNSGQSGTALVHNVIR